MNQRLRPGVLLCGVFCAVALTKAQGPPAAAPAAPAPEMVTPGELVIEPATLINLGFEWFIQGDTNRNAVVQVSYRKAGTSEWKPALPMLRLQGERIYAESRVDVIAPNMFAGSILDLEPDTPYEARFVMSDPDGVREPGERIVTVRTRAEPQPYSGGRVFHVYPHGFSGTKVEPSFEGLMCAYNYWCAGTDWATSGRPRVRPGDTILVHAGTYRYNRYEYTNNATVNRTVPLDGTYYLTADGTPDMPIAIKAAGDGEVVFDGDGNFALFDVRAADYAYFEGLTFRNTEVAIAAGTQFIAGAKGLTVKKSRFENVGAGIFTNYAGSSQFYIADNTFIGRNDPKHLIGWAGDFWTKFNGVEGQIFPPKMASYVAVKLYGPGHVVAYNYIADFHDGINVETYGNPDGSFASGPDIIDGPKYPTREYLGSPAGRDRLLQQLHHQLTRQPDRGRRQHAQHPRHAEHADQPSVARVLQSADTGWPGLLDPEHRVQPAGRFDSLDQRRRRRALLQQHGPLGNHGCGGGEHPLAQQPDARSELGARDPQRQHVHQLHLVGLQRLSCESRGEVSVRVERPTGGRRIRFHRARPQRKTRDAKVRFAHRVRRGNGAGSQQRRRRL